MDENEIADIAYEALRPSVPDSFAPAMLAAAWVVAHAIAERMKAEPQEWRPRVIWTETGEIQHDYWHGDKTRPMTVVFLPGDQIIIDAHRHVETDHQEARVTVRLEGEDGQGMD